MAAFPVTRITDMTTGHSCFPPQICLSGSNNVYINGKNAHRVGDQQSRHKCSHHSHSSVLAKGSETVYVNGLPLGRVTDPTTCGSRLMTGSNDVYAG